MLSIQRMLSMMPSGVRSGSLARDRSLRIAVLAGMTLGLGGCALAPMNRPARSADAGCLLEPTTAADMRVVTPGAAPIRCRPWTFGTELQGYVWHAPRPRAALLLQHGYSEYAQRYAKSFNGLLPHLLAAGVTVYAIDMPGHGRSPGRRGAVDASKAADLHLAARRRLRAQPLPLFLDGHSLGGLVTVTSVLRDTAGVRGVILSSPMLYRREGAALGFLAHTLAAIAPAAGTVKPDLGTISALPEEVERAQRDTMIYHGRLPNIVASTAVKLTRSNRTHYPRWHAPVLVLHGTKDRATDPEGSRRFHDAIPARDKTLYLVDGGFHELLNDTQRSETLRVVLTWMEQRLPPGR